MKKIVVFIIIFLAIFSIAIPARAADSSDFDATRLEKYLTVKANLLGISDNMSLYFEDLNHSEEIAFDPTRSWIPASTIKAFVLPEAFRQRQLGQIDFDQKITIVANNVVPTEMESNDYPTLTEGTVVTIHQLLEMMITQSDNTAYNTLLDILDRRNINATLRHLGITETIVGQKLNLDDSQAQLDANVPGYRLNTTTVKDFSTLFGLLYDGEIGNSDEILAIFKRQKINNMIPALLPQNTVIAHKTGDWNLIVHDGGIVYKPAAPFLLTIFTNANDRSAVAQMAMVAYYQTPDSVTSFKPPVPTQTTAPALNKVYLASAADTRVLAAATRLLNATYVTKAGDTFESIADLFYGDISRASEIIKRNPKVDPQNLKPGITLIIPNVPGNANGTVTKFPQMTALDLGITKSDLSIDKEDVSKIPYAIITPGSIFYPLKIWLQDRQFDRAKSSEDKIAALLSFSQSRLSETKTLGLLGNIAGIKSLLAQSQFYLVEAADLATNLPDKNAFLFKISQQNDTQMAVLAQILPRKANQEDFINMVYNFAQGQKGQLSPKIAAIKANNILAQTPVVGQVAAINAGTATIQFPDGRTQNIKLHTLTPVRKFQSKNLENTSDIKVGAKIAVLGQTDKKGEITPQFILDDIPSELTTRHLGTVTKVDPDNHSLEIQEASGQKDEVSVSTETNIRAKDTQVGLPGIRTGSVVTVFGQTESGKANNQSIKATSIEVAKNGSGKGEKEEKKPAEKPKAPQPPKPGQEKEH